MIRAIGLLRTERFRHLYAGLLCTIDVANDPVTVYDALMSLSPPRVDFLLPHATWDNPPARALATDSGYADWLITIFDRWVAGGRPTGIRTFESILSTQSGGQNLTEALGLAPPSLVVIETDGTYEQVDSLKAAFDGAPATGLNVFSHALDVVGYHPGIVARQQGLAGLCRTCQECPVVTSCGGGLYAHRYRSATGFANPSVYCADLLKLITHISSRRPEVTAEGRAVANHKLSDDDFRELAAGYGGAAAVGQLIEAQRTLRRALLGAVYRAGTTASAVTGPLRETLRTAWMVLAAADRERPEALDRVLAHPSTYASGPRAAWNNWGQPGPQAKTIWCPDPRWLRTSVISLLSSRPPSSGPAGRLTSPSLLPTVRSISRRSAGWSSARGIPARSRIRRCLSRTAKPSASGSAATAGSSPRLIC